MIDIITHEDVPELMEIARQAHAESNYQDYPFSEKCAKETFLSHIGNDGAVAMKCTRDKEIVSFFLGARNSFVFTDKHIGMETTYYVKPEYRGSRCFFLMISNFKLWCRERNLQPFLLPHFGKDNTKTYSALEKMGFREKGRFYAGEI